jgi:hypothetical protein
VLRSLTEPGHPHSTAVIGAQSGPAHPPAAPTAPPRAGALQEALDDYGAVLRLEPRSVDALYHRGALHEKLGGLDDAIRDFSAVLTLDPNHVKAGYARGACRNLKGDFFEAIGGRRATGAGGRGAGHRASKRQSSGCGGPGRCS